MSDFDFATPEPPTFDSEPTIAQDFEFVTTGLGGLESAIAALQARTVAGVPATSNDYPASQVASALIPYLPTVVFVFNTSATPGSNVYNDWASLIAAVGAVAGCAKCICFEQDETIPAGTWDLNQSTMRGPEVPDHGALVITFADGAKLTNPNAEFASHGLKLYTVSTEPVFTITSNQYAYLDFHVEIAASAAAPFFHVDAPTATTVLIGLSRGSGLFLPSHLDPPISDGDGPGATVASGSTLVVADLIGNTNLDDDVISGAGSGLRIVTTPTVANGTPFPTGDSQSGLGSWTVILLDQASRVAVDPTGFTNSSATQLQNMAADFDTAITAASSGGNVVGPASAVDLHIAQFDGATGKLLKDGGLSSASFDAAGAAALVTTTSIGAVPTTRTVNGHALSANVTVTASDVGSPSGSGTSTGANTGDQTISLTGDVTGSGTGSFATSIGANKVTSTTIAANAVTLAKVATQADQTILGNNTGGTAVPLALTAAQTKSVLALSNVTNDVQAKASQQIIAGTGLTGGGTLAADRTLTVSSLLQAIDFGSYSVPFRSNGLTTVGTWGLSTSGVTVPQMVNSSSADADSIQVGFCPLGGTYTITLVTVAAASGPKVQLVIDGSNVGSLTDCYSVSSTYTAFTLGSGIVVAPGDHTVKVLINGRNASNVTGFTARICELNFIRTA